MKLSPDSPELTAYLLGELSVTERAELEAALRQSPELQAELDSLHQANEQLIQEFAAEPVVELTTPQRMALLGAAKPVSETTEAATPTPRRPSNPEPSWWEQVLAWRRYLLGAIAGLSALVLTLFLLPRSAAPQSRELGFTEPQTKQALSLDLAASPPATQLEATYTENFQKQLVAAPTVETLVTSLATVPPSTAPEVSVEARRTTSFSAFATPADQQALAPDPSAPADPKSFYRMDSLLARRYGLMPGPQPPTTEALAQRRLTERPLDLLRSSGEAKQLGDNLTREVEVLRPPLDEPRGRWVPSGTESYRTLPDNPFQEVLSARLSTFGLDVDTASYANVRRFLRDGALPPAEAVRLEELINYFRYDYPVPARGELFAAALEIADCPWKEGHKLVRIGLQAKVVDRQERPPANLIFLLDVSGSMEPENKLPLVKRSLRLLLERLTERDSVGLVTYAGESRIALEPTLVSRDGRTRINDVIEALRAGSGTAGAAGIVDAYRLATNRFNREWVNRVILCTDGDFNIGLSDPAGLQQLIETQAKSGVFLSVFGFGLGNLKDSTMERLADTGNGNYAYVDSFSEARKLFVEQLEGTLITVAKDVKVQVEFNPTRVKSYRLLGYENRALRDRDFNDDSKDAGDVGAGHQVTVLYEIEPATPNLAGVDPLRYQTPAESSAQKTNSATRHGEELLHLRLRYKAPDGEQSRLTETPVKDSDREFAQASADFKFAAVVAGYGMVLRGSPYQGDLTWEKVLRLAEQGLGADREGYRAEFVDLVRRAQQLSGSPVGNPSPNDRPRRSNF